MSALAGTISYLVTVTGTAASSGDATTIAGMFNGLTIAGVDIAGTATGTASSTTFTITWPASQVRAGNDAILNAVTNIIAPNTALTSPVTGISVSTQAKVV